MEKEKDPHKQQAADWLAGAYVAIVVFLIISMIVFFASACNVTRTVTTKAEYYQRGDTTVQIVTRTTESYDGSVKPENLLRAK